MMEVSQNVELKELSTEGTLLRNLSSDLGSDVEPLSTPANKSTSRSSRDEDDLSSLTNGQDLPIEDVGKSISATEGQERNAGSDLDALLSKISSIVDCSPKNLDELDNPDKSEECVSVPAKEKTADIDESQLEGKVEDEKVEDEEKELFKECENKNVVLESEIETVKEIEEVIEDIEKTTQDQEIKNTEQEVEDKGESVQEKEVEEVDALPEAEKEITKDDVFEDALDSISSSDEFDAFASQDSKKAESSKEPVTEEKPAVAEDLEDISSDEENVPTVDEVEKPVTTEKQPEDVIDLDSSNECVVCETPTEAKESEAEDKPKGETEAEGECDTEAEAITVEEGVDTSAEDKKAKEAAANDPKEVAEVCMDKVKKTTVDESAESAALIAPIEEEPPLDKEAPELGAELLQEEGPKATEGPTERDPKSVEEPLEAMLVDDEPPVIDPKEIVTEHKEGRTQTQEMNDTTIDDLLMEVNTDFESKEENKSNEKVDQPVVISENDGEAKVNGVSENPTEEKTGEAEKENDVSKTKIIPGKETKENESDDEVIFFEPIDKTKTADTAAEPAKEDKPETETTDKDDDVVLVSEDEDEEVAKSPKTTENEPVKSSKKTTDSDVPSTDSTAPESTASKDLLMDNTDNACDQFDKPKTQDKGEKSAVPEDGNSNSSSSNLLRPAENAEQPESKRLRLSLDEKMSSNPEVDTELLSKAGSEEDDKKLIGKRSHDHVERSPVQGNEEDIPNKKIKTDDSDSNSSSDTLQIDLDAKDEEVDEKPAEVIKSLDEKEPKLELNPEPEIKSDVKPLRLEFLKNFRKSFDTLTRDDLEELVLQKVVEAMLVKSEFADIRTQLDKCESTLAAYRRKIAEVSKQFLDLDTVHKRVLKDLESKNSHFTAPVRITRAVGLQVGIPFKAMKPTVAVQDQSHAAGSMLAPPSGTPPKASTSPMRSPIRSRAAPLGPASAPETSTNSNSNSSTSPSPSLQQQPRSSANFGQPSAAPTACPPPVRRGCLQKITPQRPNPGASVSQQNMHRLQASPPTGGLTRGMHASKHTGSTAGMASSAVVAAAAAKAAVMRQRNATNASAAASAYMAQKQQQKQQLQQQYQTHRPGPASSSSSGLNPSPAKQVPKCTTTVQAQVPPISGATVSLPMTSAGGGVSGSYGQQQQPSLAPAKPKEKAVIDLTDEDDAAAAAAAAAAEAAQAVQASIEANARLRLAANNAVKRNAQAAVATRGRGGRGGGNVVRQSPMQLPRVNARQIVQNNGGGGQRNSIGSNITMQIRSENTPPSASRLRYSHPAPLPTSPAQPFNPAWKMPPSRPVIRISLLDTGIVISWTLEDTSPRYADCVTYQIYAYQETIHEPSTDSWRHVGDVKAMLLPMAVTLNQFQENQRYYFAVRGVDDHQRFGPFSLPKTWS